MDFPLLTHGNTHMAICFLIIIVLLFVDRSYVTIGTIICAFLVGPVAGFFLPVNERIINRIVNK